MNSPGAWNLMLVRFCQQRFLFSLRRRRLQEHWHHKIVTPDLRSGPHHFVKKSRYPQPVAGAPPLFSAKILPTGSENKVLVANKSASASCEPTRGSLKW